MCQKEPDPEKLEKQLTKTFNLAERGKCAELYQKLQNHGYHPTRIDYDPQNLTRKRIMFKRIVRSDVQLHVESKYPLKCDTCNCYDGKCEGYTSEQIEYFRKLGRDKVKISDWPKQIFSE